MMKKIVLVVFILLMATSSYADGITLQMKGATLNEIATAIATKGQVAIIISRDVNGNISIPLIDFQNFSTEHALTVLSFAAGLAVYCLDSHTYFLGKLGSDLSILQNAHSPATSNAKTFQPFQYKYSFGSQVQLKNVSIGNVFLIIATSCNVAITSSEAVEQSEIIQQITIPQMTPEVAFRELSKATGLIVTKINTNAFLVSKDAADKNKMLKPFRPSIPSNPQERRSYFIEPLHYQ
jgi:hypothetical protein